MTSFKLKKKRSLYFKKTKIEKVFKNGKKRSISDSGQTS
jgi:hypothetical protein